MKRVLLSVVLAAACTAAQAANETPEQCKAQGQLMPADQRDGFMKACLSQSATAPSTVSPEQRAKSCDVIAAREKFEGEQLAAFLKGCRGS